METSMKRYSVVARYKDGTIVKGKTADFSPFKPFFHVENEGEETVMIDTEQLKAIFFVKDSEEDEETDKYRHIKELGGKKIIVHFIDGEEITGYALKYSSAYNGFFVTPADVQSNNQRIYVITSATEKITFL